jgi:hypothetical protein
MLHQGNKLLMILCLIIAVVSCNRYKKYDTKEINEIRNRSIAKSQSVIGQDEYWDIYNKINDSIDNWKINNLGLYKYFSKEKGLNFIVDSIICYNKECNKFITSVCIQCLSNCVSDDIWYFLGVKIRGEWYFFAGATLVLPREYYQKDIHTPLSFEKLKQIATRNIYRRYLVENKNGEWEINDRFFSDLTSGAWCSDCVTQEQWDSAYIRQVNRNWSKRDKR